MTELVPYLIQVAKELRKKGFHEVPPFWRDTLTKWLTGPWRQLVLRVGRRGGKSSTLCLLAVVIALFGRFQIPLGDTGVIAVVSVDRREAMGRINTIAEMLRALNVPHKVANDTIELPGRNIKFQVFTASVAGVSGFTCVFAICDEVAKWRDTSTGRNPAKEVLASLRPTMATIPNARIVLSSSPLANLDAHYEAFERGTNTYQLCIYAPTWVANPSLSEADTRALEPDARTWLREYRAIPQAAVSAAFEPDHIDRAMQMPPDPEATYYPALASFDPSRLKGGGDHLAYCFGRLAIPGPPHPYLQKPYYSKSHPTGGKAETVIAGYTDCFDAQGNRIPNPDYMKPRPPVLVVGPVQAITGVYDVTEDRIAAKVAQDCKRQGATRMVADQYDEPHWTRMFRQHGIKYIPLPWTSALKSDAVGRMRRLLADKRIKLPADDTLRRELYAYSEEITAAGNIRYTGPSGRGVDDRVSAVLGLVIGELRGELAGSPVNRRGGRYELSHDEMAARSRWRQTG